MALQTNAKLVVSDSGTITEEASIMNIKAVNLRTTHMKDRKEDVGVLPMTDFFSKEGLLRSASMSIDRDVVNRPSCYDNLSFSDAIIQILSGYTQYINRTTYFEK